MKEKIFLWVLLSSILLGLNSCSYSSKNAESQLLKELLKKAFITPRLNENDSFRGEGHILLRDKDGNAVHIDRNGEIISTLKDSMDVHKYILQLNYPNSLYPIKDNYKWGLVDKNENIVIPCMYDEVMPIYEKALYWVCSNNQWGCINRNGEVTVPTLYSKPQIINDSYFRIKDRNKEGLVSPNGEIIVPCIYESVSFCDGNYFEVSFIDEKRNRTFGLYDNSGKMLLDCEYDEIVCGTEGMYVWIKCKKNDRWQYYLGAQGRWGDVDFSTTGYYTHAEHFKNGYARVFKGEQYGFLSLYEQREIIPCIYNHSFEHYGHGVFVLWNDDVFAITNEARDLLTPYKYKHAYVSDKYISVQDANTSKWGLLDYNGNEIIPTIYDRSFSIENNGKGITFQNGKGGCIDINNNVVIPFEYDKIVYEKNGYIATYTNDVLKKLYNDKWELTQFTDMQILEFYNLYITCLTCDGEMMVNVKDRYYLKDVIPNVIIKTDNKEEVKKQLIGLCSQIANYLLGGNANVDLTQMALGQEDLNLFLYNDNAFNFK